MNLEVSQMVIIRCSDCKHRWECKSKLIHVICASCGKKIKRDTIDGKLIKGGK